jgi:outer membrane protein OmpA-like peptidoglycan-associated protein
MYHHALSLQAKRQSEKAIQALHKTIREFPGYTEAYSLLGRWLFESHRFEEAATIFLQGEKINSKTKSSFAKAAAKSLLYNGNYAQAQQYLPSASADAEWQALTAQAAFLKVQMAVRDTTIKVQPIGGPYRINSTVPELFPFCSADGATFYFTRRVAGMDEDFYSAKRDSCGGWLSARNMGSPPNSTAQESAQMISADRHYLFFTRCDNRSPNGWDMGGCDLYMAYTADSIWSTPLSFGATINSPSYEGMPCLSADNRELFFVSDRPGGFGGMDLWSSRFEHGLWQLPYNLGAAINTPGNETAPFMCADGRTLFFASTGHIGMGGSDLFTAHREEESDTIWTNITNLGMPINTAFDEVSMSVNAAGDTAYFASDRGSIAGNFDLYEVPLPEAVKPGKICYFQGAVYDSLSREPLNYANIYFTDSTSGREQYHLISNRGDGSYTIALPVGHTYGVMISRVGYQQALDTFRSDSVVVRDPLHHSIALLPYDHQKPVHDSLILTIHFQKNSTTVTDSMLLLLKAALEPWQGKPELSLLVNGYTDNSGTPLLNEQISGTRARAIGEALQGIGFPAESIQAQGRGEAAPAAGNETEKDRNKNRRVEIVVRYH